MSTEKEILEQTLIELCNSVWFNTLSTLKDRAHCSDTYHDYENDPDCQFREGILNANSRTLGRLLNKLKNTDLSLMVNGLKLVKRDYEKI